MDRSKLGVLTQNSEIEIERLQKDEYWVRFKDRNWFLWTKSPRWIEVVIEDKPVLVGEMHYGSVSVFYQKNIVGSPSLPANHGKKWVQQDIELLERLIERELSIEEVAKQMGRSASSVIAKTGDRLGISFEHLIVSTEVVGYTFKELIDSVVQQQIAIETKVRKN